MQKILPYSIPIFVTFLYLYFCFMEQFWTSIVLFPILTSFHFLFGKFTINELRDELIYFQSSRIMKCFLIFNAIYFIFFQLFVIYFILTHEWSWINLIFFIYGIIIINSNFTTALAHELMHFEEYSGRCLGRILLVSNGFYYLEFDHKHIHHKYVATLNDPASALLNQPLALYLKYSIGSRMKAILFKNGMKYIKARILTTADR